MKRSKRFLTVLSAILFLVTMPLAAFADTYYWSGYGYTAYPGQVAYDTGYYEGMPVYVCNGYLQYTPCTSMYQQYNAYQQPYYSMYNYPQMMQMYPQQQYDPRMFTTNMNTNVNISNNMNTGNAMYVPQYGYAR